MPRLGSRVRIPSPAPNFLNEIRAIKTVPRGRFCLESWTFTGLQAESIHLDESRSSGASERVCRRVSDPAQCKLARCPTNQWAPNVDLTQAVAIGRRPRRDSQCPRHATGREGKPLDVSVMVPRDSSVAGFTPIRTTWPCSIAAPIHCPPDTFDRTKSTTHSFRQSRSRRRTPEGAKFVKGGPSGR